MTIANQMLSLLGSIQPDPFSPDHVPRPEQLQSISQGVRAPSPPDNVLAEIEGDGVSDADEEDPFVEASKLRAEPTQVAEAVVETEKALAKAEKAKRKEEKRKRKGADEHSEKKAKKKKS